MKKRVLMVSTAELGNSGVSAIVMLLCRQLRAEYTFDLVTLSEKEGTFDEEFRSFGGEIFRLHVRQYADNRLLYPLSFFQIKKQLQTILKQRSYDIIHGHTGYYDGIFHWLGKNAGVNLRIAHAHGTYTWGGINFVMRGYLRFSKELTRRNANVRLACSDLAGKSLFLGKPFVNVLNPVDAVCYRRVKRSEKKGLGLVQIGYFCRLKNQMFSLALLQRLLQDGVDARLELIGYPNEEGYEERMHGFIAQNGLEEHVRFLPPDVDKVQAFSDADFCLLPSVSEGLPLTALEAQAARVVCLMSDHISSDADIGAARFLPHDDLDAWAEQIKVGAKPDPVRLEQSLERCSQKAYVDTCKSIYGGSR